MGGLVCLRGWGVGVMGVGMGEEGCVWGEWKGKRWKEAGGMFD